MLKELAEIKVIVTETKEHVAEIRDGVNTVKTDVQVIKEQLSRLIQQHEGAAARDYPEARTCFVQLRLKPQYSEILSNPVKGLGFLNKIESLPAQIEPIKTLGAWGPSAPVASREKREWAHVAHILTSEARDILMNHLRKLPEVELAQLQCLTDQQEASLLPTLMTMARHRQSAADSGPFRQGFEPWRGIKLDPSASAEMEEILFPGGVPKLNPGSGSIRFRQLITEEAAIPRLKPGTPLPDFKGMMVKRAEFAMKAQASQMAGEITKPELDLLAGLNRRHSLGMD